MMDPIDLFQQHELRQLQEETERLRTERDLMGWDLRKVKELAEENVELKLRLSVLLRLLIARGVFSAEEFANLLSAARQEASS